MVLVRLSCNRIDICFLCNPRSVPHSKVGFVPRGENTSGGGRAGARVFDSGGTPQFSEHLRSRRLRGCENTPFFSLFLEYWGMAMSLMPPGTRLGPPDSGSGRALLSHTLGTLKTGGANKRGGVGKFFKN